MSGGVPLFSVIIPTFQRPERLLRCVRALLAQSFAEPFEIIVVNDGGPELPELPTPGRNGITLQLLRQQNSGPATARNLGASVARGHLLAFTDDDCEPEPGWLTALHATLAADPETMAGGHTVNALTANLWSEASQLLVDFLYEFYVEDGVPHFFTSNNFALERDAFLQAGGFSARFPLAAAEDREFCTRWRTGGGRMTLTPGAVIRHYHHLTPLAFLHQHFRYGRGAWQFRKNLPEDEVSGTRIEPLRFYLDLIGYPLRKDRLPLLARVACQAMLLAAQAVNAAGFFYEALFAPSRVSVK